MKPLRLEIRGFTAFRESTVVEFDGRRLFVITGPTGAGKSSLLDAMIWALYGQVPRVGNRTRQLITHGEKSMSVRFDFTARGETYRVSRRAPATTGTRLERQIEGDSWQPLADRARDVTAQVTEILGLDYSTFTKTVVLPQGAFDSFLRGDEGDRRAILTRLLGLDTYEAVGRTARARSKSASELADQLRLQLGRLKHTSAEDVAALEQELQKLDAAIAAGEQRREQVADLGRLARTADDSRKALDAARAAAAASTSALAAATEAERQAEAAVVVAQAAALAAVSERDALAYDPAAHATMREVAATISRRDEAQATLTAAESEVAAAGERQTLVAATVAQHEKESVAASKLLATATSALAAAARSAAGEAARLRAEIGQNDEERVASERLATEQRERMQALDGLGTRATALDGERTAAIAARARAGEASTEAAALRDRAASTLAAAGEASTERQAELDSTRQRHAAATLQRDLKPGDRCPVCGETLSEVAHNDIPDLDRVDEAASAALAALTSARSEHTAVAATAARAEAEMTAADGAVAGVDARFEALRVELAPFGVSSDGIAAAIDEARASEAAARVRVVASQEQAAGIRAEEQAIGLLLARVPASDDATAATFDKIEAAASERPEAASSLSEALDAHATASEQATASAAAAREAAPQLRAEQRAVEQVEAGRVRAVATLETVTTKLATLTGDDPIDAARVVEMLAGMEQRAQQSQQLAAAASSAQSAEAAVTARRDERQRERGRVSVETDERAKLVATDEATEAQARAAFAERRDGLANAEAIDAAAAQDIAAIETLFREIEAETRTAAQALGGLRERIDRARSETIDAEQMRTSIAAHEQMLELARGLAQDLSGDRFIGYVQQEALRVLAADASVRLRQLTNGRYRLVLDDGDFAVIDHMNGDEQRSVKTLSGGETFLTSLALSLALSERLPELAGTGGAVSLESLFLDEGFGSLDAQSLDVAIEGLEALADPSIEGRMVGVISHVPQLAERLDDRIEVLVGEETSVVA